MEINIVNGGIPLAGCPANWDEARTWLETANGSLPEDGPKWSWDCGLKLDFDGGIVHISSRFYPPKSNYGPTWDGSVTIWIGGTEFSNEKFDCPTLEELKGQVEKYVHGINEQVTSLLKSGLNNI